MSANIAEVNGKTMMAYQGETPWHKLGAVMAAADVPAALAAANLNWNVALKPMYYRVADRMVKVVGDTGQPSRFAVVRDTDNQLLATVGSDYVPVQNSKAFAVLQPACEQLGVTIETAGALGKGDRVWMLARLPQVIEPVLGDKINQYFLVLTGHNGWTSFTARGTDVRVVCQNTLSMATAGSKALIKLRHVESTTDQLDQVAETVTLLMSAARERGEVFSKLADKKFTASELNAYVNEVLDITETELTGMTKRRRDRIIELAATGKGAAEFAPGSAWSAFNSITEYVDHVRPAENKSQLRITSANQSALFGTNMKLKQRALKLAVKLAA